MMTTYLTIDAPGYHGDWIEVHAQHSNRSEAIRYASRRGNTCMVVSIADDFASEYPAGKLFHRQFSHAYPAVWSPRTAVAAAAARAQRRIDTDAENVAARKYGRGSEQYGAAMDNYAITGKIN